MELSALRRGPASAELWLALLQNHCLAQLARSWNLEQLEARYHYTFEKQC